MIKVLVIEDNDDIRFLVATILGAEDVVVEEAGGGLAGLAALTRSIPDIVLLDVQMPDLSGWEVLASIRADAVLDQVPVVMCTVKGRPEDLVHGWESGCDGYLTKPFEVEGLVETVREVAARTPEERARVRAEGLRLARQEAEQIEAAQGGTGWASAR